MKIEFFDGARSVARSFLFTQNTVRYRIEYKRLAQAFQLIGRQGRILDGGAGSGEMLRKLHRDDWCGSGQGLEPDPKLFGLMQKNFRRDPGLSCTNAGLLEVPFPDASFDCAMSTQVLEHIEDHARAASELARVVKPGGFLVISVPHPPEPFPNPGHVREGYTEEDLRALFPPIAFEHLHTDYFFTKPTLDRVLKAERLPLKGIFVPVVLMNAEASMTAEERKAARPFGIMTVFKKRA